MILFTVKCSMCGSEDVSFSSSVNEFDHIDTLIICNNCKIIEDVDA